MSLRSLFVLLMASGTILTTTAASAATMARIDLKGIDKLKIIPLDASTGGRVANITWGEPLLRPCFATAEFPVRGSEWTPFHFRFKSDADGKVTLVLIGPLVKNAAGKQQRVDILWDDLTAQGCILVNGNFEKASGSNPAGWFIYTPQDKTAIARYLPAGDRRGRNESAALMTWHNGGAVQTIAVKKDETVEISGYCKLADLPRPEAPQPRIVVTANPQWQAVQMADLNVKPGTALDLTPHLPADPAGSHGRVIVNRNGHFAFADRPDQEVRFVGCTYGDVELNQLKTKEDVRNFAVLLRRQGYNMMRLHFLDFYLMAGSQSDFDFNLKHWDTLDYLVACLKENGIYIYFDAMTSGLGFQKGSGWGMIGNPKYPNRIDMRKAIITTEAGKRHWLAGVTKILTHVNPYTKTRLVDDPVVAVLLFANELEFYSITKGAPEAMHPQWQAWLKQRYGNDPARLAQTWNDPKRFRPDMKFENIPLFTWMDQWEASVYGDDVGRFMVNRETALTEWFTQAIRGIGYPGLITVWDMGKQYRNNLSRMMLPVICMHNYYAHPTKWLTPGSTVRQESSFVSATQYFRCMAATRFIDRPFFISEYGHVFWSRSRYEEGLVVGGYSALQGYQGLMIHAAPVRLTPRPRIVPFDNGSDPIGRANQVMTMFLFARRDAQTSPNYIELNLDKDFLEKGGKLNLASDGDDKLALVTRFGVWCGGADQAAINAKPEPLHTLTPRSAARVSTSANTMDVVESAQAGQGLDRIVDDLKQRRLIPADNLTNPSRGIFQSDTGELLMNTRKHFLTVITPCFEGIASDQNTATGLRAVTRIQASVPSAAAVISLDKQPLADSRRMLLIFSTDALNSGMELSIDHTTLYAVGKAPTLMLTGQLQLELKNRRARQLSVWALAFDGTRREKLSAGSGANGVWCLALDTAKLKNGPTPFFEIAVEP